MIQTLCATYSLVSRGHFLHPSYNISHKRNRGITTMHTKSLQFVRQVRRNKGTRKQIFSLIKCLVSYLQRTQKDNKL